MFVPETFTLAMVMMVTSTICWGSWANTYKLTKNYRFELFYWDYAIGIFVVSLIFAFTLGSTGGSGESFLANVAAADRGNIVSAMIGGFIFNIANLLLVAGIEIAGLAVAFPVAIGIALVVGVIMSYAIQPVGDPVLLGLGVGLALLAVILDGKAYSRLSQDGEGVSKKGLIICVVSGLLMGSFAPFVTRSLTTGHALTPYSISVFFTLAALLSCFVVNVYFMKRAAGRNTGGLLGVLLPPGRRTMRSASSEASSGARARSSISLRPASPAWRSLTPSVKRRRWSRRLGASSSGASSRAPTSGPSSTSG